MRKLLFGAATLLAICACEDEVTNPGDFSMKATLEVTSIKSADGTEYPVTIVREIDTIYQASRYNTETDELEWYDTNTRGHYVELAVNTLEPAADTLYIKLKSNAKWKAPMPDGGGKTQWFFTQRQAGGGDGTVIATTTRNRNKMRPINAAQYIMTSDSAVMYKVTFAQKGEKD